IPSAADFFVHSIPSLANSSSLLTYAGYLPARPDAKDDAHLYFFLEKARHLGAGKKRRLMLWLNGGPGCSSFDGLMMEIGSFRPSMTIKERLEWTVPGGAWNEYTDVLFLDQPVGTGFSYTSTDGYAHSLGSAAKDVVHFLKQFVAVFPEYGADAGCDFFIAGESYAGQYIPYTADALLADPKNPLALQGIAIGNGAIDPRSQAGSELDMMIESGVWKKGGREYNEMKPKNDVCEAEKRKLKEGEHPQEIDGCEGLLQDIIELTYQPASPSSSSSSSPGRCINIYDTRLSDTHPACGMNWPPTLAPTYTYLAKPEVRNAFHVSATHHPEAWIECSSRVSAGLSDKSSPASVTLLPGLLERGIKVLLFAGDQDLICNWIGVERVVQNLHWSGTTGWGSSPPPKRSWTVNGTSAGWWQETRNLTFVSVAGASHMVGFDKPLESADMILRWMSAPGDQDLVRGAAGPSALIPSTLEGERERLVLSPAPPPSAAGGVGEVSPGQQGKEGMIVGADGKSEAQVAEEAKWAAYYNAGSAALVFLILLVGFGTCFLLRGRRRMMQRGLHLGGVTGAGTGAGAGAKGGSFALNGGGGEGSLDEQHELSHLVANQERLSEDDDDDEQET
ncbi:alpha/beta-hydrolase, partial [Jaminaea rosea]